MFGTCCQCAGQVYRNGRRFVPEREITSSTTSFIDCGAVQCGYCTPGMLMSAKALLDKNPSPTEEEIKEAIGNNYCRCTGYYKIVEAIRQAAEMMREVKGE